jgi:hypothetical protein
MRRSDISDWDEPAPKMKMPTKRRDHQDRDEEYSPRKGKDTRKRSNRKQNPREELWEDLIHEKP